MAEPKDFCAYIEELEERVSKMEKRLKTLSEPPQYGVIHVSDDGMGRVELGWKTHTVLTYSPKGSHANCDADTSFLVNGPPRSDVFWIAYR